MKNLIKAVTKTTKKKYNNFDPLGMYTGNDTLSQNPNEKPVQDADDL